jgi:hypothetical protein
LAFALAGCLIAMAVVAQTAPPTRIRGTLDAVASNALTIKTREGPKVEVMLNDPLTVMTVKRLTLDDIKQGSYVGVTSKTGADGKAQAIEVHVIPAGTGEGHRPWDLQPGTMMTNANVTAVVDAKTGRDLTLTYQGGSQQIMVPTEARIVTFAPAARSDLKLGAYVLIFAATPNAEGKLATSRVTVGTNGVNPPM